MVGKIFKKISHKKHYVVIIVLVFGLLLTVSIALQRQDNRGRAAGTTLSFTLFLHGLGKGGDSANPTALGTTNPLRLQRTVTVEIYNAQNQLVLTKQGTIAFNSTAGNYTGSIDRGTLPTGTYLVKVKADQYLRANVPGIQSIALGQDFALPPTTLITGDINNDNAVSILDYNILLGCYSDLAPATNCTSTNKPLADLTDDGKVNQYDYNLYLRESSNRQGDPGGGTVAPTPTKATTPTPTRTPTPTPTRTPTPTPATGGSCPAGQIGTPPNCFPTPPAPAAAGKQWKVIFSEEFSGTSLTTSKLTPCFDWNFGACTVSFNTGKERYLPEQVRVSNGTAKLVAEPLSPSYANSGCFNGQCTYKAGLVSTARPRADNGSSYLFPFTYGYVESRMKFPATPGFFTAFWMLPTNPSFSYDTEIDIVEILGGHPDTIFMTYHYNGRGSSHNVNNGLHNNGSCPVKNYSQDFVRFGIDWQPTYVAWYIDGVKCGQFNGNTTTVENGPMQLILHMMVDNKWERDWGSVLTDQTLIRQLEVDYIRIYQQ